VSDVLLLVDVLNSFRHEDGDRLAASFRQRFPGLRWLVDAARAAGLPAVYANDNWGVWDSDVRRLVADAAQGLAGELVEAIAPSEGDRVIVKPRYSAFTSTPLHLILDDLDATRLLVAGTATEMCVTQTAIDARDAGYKVSVIADACSTVDERDEELALRYLERVADVHIRAVADVFPLGA
jgi:nicotinamidase-related amidase